MLEEKLKALDRQYAELEARLAAPETYDDPTRVARLNKEQRDLEPVVTAYRTYVRRQKDLADAQALMSDPDMKELAQEEYQAAKADLERLVEEIRILLLSRDPNDAKNVIVEIRAGVGGEEAALFANSLYRMYCMYAESRRWQVEVDSVSETELGGVKEICFTIQGDGAYSRLKFESGVHRVQRVPETESGGRIHTSTVTVAVLPEVDEVDFALNPADIEMQVFRSSGAGGQHVNKTSSAVRLIHKPTGTVVECQQERSQFQNRDRAMQILRARLYEEKVREQADAVTSQRRSQVGTGMRNERIRTYNFPQGRLTDHRVGLTLYRLDSVMNGDIDEIIDALITADQAERLKHQEQGG
ncbi:peptide chain release factor 1 [Intestinimonas massiliensis]|uniref:Peptide chain release factor 1 n=1 Tax=Intestinimonas massiliensis (ex Afouda et al. 2020) TaxID=1673721 RepID=A0ABS9MBZ4_9FIRM|nr:peptide chain release factor 1 [Intestinimonas massiliensis (ex Afouda et al. 2020)]MCG4528318.1 peptide chain release factor 1 [Intestinimonas massiliensis (ex Afouda et al. 2020)]MCQ4806103.1 peptide chain release factor 1 [Intestinimonas massiliensis (ex Afouda et al. 2020)]